MAFENLRGAQRNTYIHIRINRNVCIAVTVSLLVHALLLLFLSQQDLLNQTQPASAQRQTITVRLNPQRRPREEKALLPDEPVPQPTPIAPARKAVKPKPIPQPFSPSNTPRILSTPQEAPALSVPPPVLAEQRPPATPKPTAPDPAQFTDMMAYVNAAREKRRSAGTDADRVNEEAAAQERGRAEDEAKIANLKRNPQPSGTNGIFQIISMDARTAQFAFRGWKNEFSFSHREVYEVNAGADGSLPKAVVRKMIEIIRRYYTGDFNWESQRFGRVIVLSARLQDNEGLEDFMLQEFFGSRGNPDR